MRFVVQSHSDATGGHYDLMLEDGAALATWRIDRLPVDIAPGQAIDAVELPAHRLAYLSYEGPISSGRGEVKIALAGEYETLRRGQDEWEFELKIDRARRSLSDACEGFCGRETPGAAPTAGAGEPACPGQASIGSPAVAAGSDGSAYGTHSSAGEPARPAQCLFTIVRMAGTRWRLQAMRR